LHSQSLFEILPVGEIELIGQSWQFPEDEYVLAGHAAAGGGGGGGGGCEQKNLKSIDGCGTGIPPEAIQLLGSTGL